MPVIMIDPHCSDEVLLRWIARRAHQADDALELLYERHAPAIYTLLIRLVREPTLAEGILGETFWWLWQEAQHLPEDEAPFIGLWRTAHGQALLVLRQQAGATARQVVATAATSPIGHAILEVL